VSRTRAATTAADRVTSTAGAWARLGALIDEDAVDIDTDEDLLRFTDRRCHSTHLHNQ
jgi:hypothetical protein